MYFFKANSLILSILCSKLNKIIKDYLVDEEMEEVPVLKTFDNLFRRLGLTRDIKFDSSGSNQCNNLLNDIFFKLIFLTRRKNIKCRF